MVVGAEEAQTGVDGRRAASEGDGVIGVLERREVGLEVAARRVAAAAVDVLARDPELFLDVGRGGVDRRYYGTGGGVGILADVDRFGGEALVLGGRRHAGSLSISRWETRA